jgi:hypothetical protein
MITRIIFASSTDHEIPPLHCHLVLLTPKYPSQQPTLEHPQPVFLPQCKRPSFTPIQNNRHNYSSRLRRTENISFHGRRGVAALLFKRW